MDTTTQVGVLRRNFFRVIGCEIAARELYFCASRSPSLIDFDLLTQGYHDTPQVGRDAIQNRIDAVPSGKYGAILLGYGLCSNILTGLSTAHTPLVIPRAHDCITLFLGSKERYQQCFEGRPGTYYYTSGWLECAQRRGNQGPVWGGASLPASANTMGLSGTYEDWVKKYGEDQAKFLLEEMSRWAESYSHGTLIDFDFTKPLKLAEEAKRICGEKGWEYSELPGSLDLLQNLVDGNWAEKDFLVVQPGEKVVPSFDELVVRSEKTNQV